MAAKTRPNSTERSGNPVWYLPLMLGFMVAGLLWIIVYYLSSTYPIPGLGSWNILVGFAVAFVGFLMTTRWK